MLAVLDHLESVTDAVTTFWFKPEKTLAYTAGQFIEMRLPHDNMDARGDRRWFTLSSSPSEPLLGVTTRMDEPSSSFKQALQQLQPGSSVTVTDSMGDFVLPMNRRLPLAFIVGGIGVTPVRSIIKWLADSSQQRDITIVYGARNPADFCFRDLFGQAGITTHLVVPETIQGWEGSVGPITPQLVRQLVPDLATRTLYFSGPETMVEQIVTTFKQDGIKPYQLVTDYFPGYPGF